MFVANVYVIFIDSINLFLSYLILSRGAHGGLSRTGEGGAKCVNDMEPFEPRHL